MGQDKSSAVKRRMTKKILVTGGGGFLGSRLVQHYLELGMRVRAVGHLKRLSSESQCLPAGLEYIDLEVCDLGAVLDAFTGQDLVIHTAAVVRANTPEERELQRRVNVSATQNVIEACRRNSVPRLVHVSTTAAIGISKNAKMPADDNFHFNLDHLGLSYNSTKHQAERLVLDANDHNLETVVVNPGFMFGRHQGGYRGGEVIGRVLHSRLVICTGGGLSVVHVDDVVDGISRVADKGGPGQRYILSGENLTFREVARTVCLISGRKKIVISIADTIRDLAGFLRRDANTPLYLHRYYAYQFYSSEKARREVGYQPRSFASIVVDYLDAVECMLAGENISALAREQKHSK
jgi:dihydroflavonol-4-reductase